MSRKEILRMLSRYGQQRILSHYHRLSSEEQRTLLEEMERLDLPLVFKLHRLFCDRKEDASRPRRIEPTPIQSIPKNPQQEKEREEARQLGESIIRGNQVAALIVAGGQGTRLGFPGPKGRYPISPVKKKSLFQLFAESIRAISARYQAHIPLLIMTSRENDEETKRFFAEHRFFGLERDGLFFFSQQMLPTLTPEGRLILQDRAHLLLNPDGHGGSLKALYESGLLRTLVEKGFTELFYCQVDNPLVRMVDPIFIGYHRKAEAEISTKVVRRQNLEEKVGIYGAVNDRPVILEYSDFRPEDYRAVDEEGNIRHWAGNTAVHLISLAFIERLSQRGFALPYHRAIKETEIAGENGKAQKMTVAKFETFVFDAIPLARKTCCVEVLRQEEFSPVKNLDGIDSPETARAAMNALYRGWLKEAGAEVDPQAQVEISPLLALDKEELISKLKGQKMSVAGECYLGD